MGAIGVGRAGRMLLRGLAPVSGPLRAPTGASSLATGYRLPLLTERQPLEGRGLFATFPLAQALLQRGRAVQPLLAGTAE